MCSDRRQGSRSVAEKRSGALWRVSVYISYHAESGNVKERGKVILDPHPDSDQHQNLITSTASPLPMPVMFGRYQYTRW